MHSRFLFEPARYPKSIYLQLFDRYFGADRNLSAVCSFVFEPNPLHAPRHRELSAAYHAMGWRYEFIPAAVGAKSGHLTFHHNSKGRSRNEHGQELGFGVKNRDGRRRLSTAVVPIVNLVDFIRDEVLGRVLPQQQVVADGHSLPPAVLMKMDVESAEFAIVPALVSSRILCDAVNFLTIEWHTDQRFLPVDLTGLSPGKAKAALNLSTVREATAQKEHLQLKMAAQTEDHACATHYGTSGLDDESYFNDRTPLPLALTAQLGRANRRNKGTGSRHPLSSSSAAPSLSLNQANYMVPGADGHSALSCTAPWFPYANASGPSVALFTYNFGDYRREFTHFPDSGGNLATVYSWHRDRYMFVDAATFSNHTEKVASLRKDGWIVCAIPDKYIREEAVPSTIIGLHVSAGWDLTKYLKFGHVPTVLARYEYVYHLDASIFMRSRPYYRVHEKNELKAFLARRPDVGLILTRHPSRSAATLEWAATLKHNMEQRKHVDKFECAMTRLFGKQGVAAAPNFAMGMWIRNLRDARINAAFRETFRALKAFGLKRDQNVFGFALWDALGADCATRVAVCDCGYSLCEAAMAPQNVTDGGHLDRTMC